MKLGRVEVSRGALLLLAWLLYRRGEGLAAGLFAACLLHELGHIFMLFLMDISVKLIYITAFGAKICLERMMTYPEELVAAAAGPAVNLLLALLWAKRPGGQTFAGINLSLAIFNLLPVGMLDGGRLLSCLLALWMEEGQVWFWRDLLERLLLSALAGLGWGSLLCFGNPALLWMTGWLWMGRRGKNP